MWSFLVRLFIFQYCQSEGLNNPTELFLLGPEALNMLAFPGFFHANHRIWFRAELHFFFFHFNMLKALQGHAGVKRRFTNLQQTRGEWKRGSEIFLHSCGSEVENVSRLISSAFLTFIQWCRPATHLTSCWQENFRAQRSDCFMVGERFLRAQTRLRPFGDQHQVNGVASSVKPVRIREA